MKRRNRKPPSHWPRALAHPKAKGELAELIFMVKATSLGLSVAKVFGDNQPHDVVVSSRSGRVSRVQVKSAWTRGGSNYEINVLNAKGIRQGGYDFLVAYVAEMDAWYVIPENEVPLTPARLPARRGRDKRLEKYRDAWRLLTGDPADDSRSLGITIHAQADLGG